MFKTLYNFSSNDKNFRQINSYSVVLESYLWKKNYFILKTLVP